MTMPIGRAGVAAIVRKAWGLRLEGERDKAIDLVRTYFQIVYAQGYNDGHADAQEEALGLDA